MILYTAKSVHNYTTRSQLNSYNITLDLTNENVAKCVNFFSSIIFTSYKISTGDKIWYWIITGWITLSAQNQYRNLAFCKQPIHPRLYQALLDCTLYNVWCCGRLKPSSHTWFCRDEFFNKRFPFLDSKIRGKIHLIFLSNCKATF